VLDSDLAWLGLVLLGVIVGAYGTLIGAGGGFVLVPLLLILYPSAPPEQLTSISLAVVFLNALSGTAAYLRQRRVDLLAGSTFAAATVPGAIVGALTTALLPRRLFDAIIALTLLAISVLLLFRPGSHSPAPSHGKWWAARRLTDAQGENYAYAYNLPLGIAVSVIVGFLSSLLGIGGGIVHVPVMIAVLSFPAHVATATSHYVLVVTAGTGTLVHLLSGQYDEGLGRTLPSASAF
jgi:uncharacterized membrane protein YfcA